MYGEAADDPHRRRQDSELQCCECKLQEFHSWMIRIEKELIGCKKVKAISSILALVRTVKEKVQSTSSTDVAEQILFFDRNLKSTSNEQWKSIQGSEGKNTATTYLTNSRVEGWWSVLGSKTRTVHQNTTLKRNVTSIAHATRVRYGSHSGRHSLRTSARHLWSLCPLNRDNYCEQPNQFNVSRK